MPTRTNYVNHVPESEHVALVSSAVKRWGEPRSHAWSPWASGTQARSAEFLVPSSVQGSGSSLPDSLLARTLKRIISRPPSPKLPHGFSTCHGLQATPLFLQGFILVVVVHVIIGGVGILRAEALQPEGPWHVIVLHSNEPQQGRDPRFPRCIPGRRSP